MQLWRQRCICGVMAQQLTMAIRSPIPRGESVQAFDPPTLRHLPRPFPGTPPPQAAEEATLEELLTCQVTRSQLEEWYTQPFFERDALTGCVVRMAYGPGIRDTSGNTHPGYMIMEVRP